MPATNYVFNMAMSLDGFIADAEGGVGWLDGYMSEEFGFDGFLDRVDTLVMGRVTYEQVRGFGNWPYGTRRTLVMASQPLAMADHPRGVEIWGAGLPALLAHFETRPAGTTWVVGGAGLMAGFVAAGARPRMDLAIIPVLLGTGIPLFGGADWRSSLRLEGVRAISNGAATLSYQIV